MAQGASGRSERAEAPRGEATRVAPYGMVSSDDHLASQAGLAMLRAGGSAADAAVAASAVLAVTFQPMCGLGGDLLAVVYPGSTSAPLALTASGRAGTGSDARRLRAEGRQHMPFADDPRCVTVPGCVDGWLELHRRFGRLPFSDLLEPAISYARRGFPCSPVLAALAPEVSSIAPDFAGPLSPGSPVLRPRLARVLEAVVRDGRDGFYGGETGRALLEAGRGVLEEGDLRACQAEWSPAIEAEAWGHRLWTTPPSSQGYLTLAGAWIAWRAGLPEEAADPMWAHLLVESARQAAYDRIEVLHDRADGTFLVSPERLEGRRRAIDPGKASGLPHSFAAGDTIALCAVDAERQGVSLLQSIASAWGSRIALGDSGIFLHNRGTGFSLLEGHPAECTPGRRPPHTLSPVAVTGPDGKLRCVLGTMGGDSQPQILLQLLARVLHAGESPGRAVSSGRWSLESKAEGWDLFFGTWGARGRVRVALEEGAPAAWEEGLAARGHEVVRKGPSEGNFGHAHLIEVSGPFLAGAADPRPRSGAAAGW
jgi:gamma-glutamyltranspeptidase/glutathione hydrolase